MVGMNRAQIFSKIDCKKGYHQLELSLESRYITTFATHQGLYKYKQLSFGIIKHTENLLRGILGRRNIFDEQHSHWL